MLDFFTIIYYLDWLFPWNPNFLITWLIKTILPTNHPSWKHYPWKGGHLIWFLSNAFKICTMFINFVESNIPFYIMKNISGLNIPFLSAFCARLTYKLFIFCFVLFLKYFFQPCSSTESVELLYLNFWLRLFFIFHLELQTIYFNFWYFFKSTPLIIMSSPTLYFEFLHHHLNMWLFL